MLKTMLLRVFLVVIISSGIDAQTACSNYWQYVRGSGQIEGLLTLPLNSAYSEHNLKVQLSVGTQLPSSYVGEISLVKDKNSAIRDVGSGQPVQYRVKFPVHNPLPKLTEVLYNNRKLCVGPKDTGTFVTTINLDHALFTTNNGQSSQLSSSVPNYNNFQQPEIAYRPQVQQTLPPTQAPTRPPPIQTRPPPVQTRPLPQVTNVNRYTANSFTSSGECGVPFKNFDETTGLVINGRTAKKGQFPWLAAYYHNGGSDNGFICGGSLVSSKAVITAAHCVHNKQSTPRQAVEAFFHIGRYYLNDHNNERDYIISPVEQFIVHPEWNAYHESFDADIAIARLSRVITFTAFIKPICLWQSSNDHSDIVRRTGIVAGYGKTSASISVSSNIPMWAALPVVDDGTCLRSHPQFSKITSTRTFCVGNRDGSGPCNGDSGGGYIVRNNEKWYLRGIVSSSLIDPNTYACDVNNYAVFTDVAAFSSWIQQYI